MKQETDITSYSEAPKPSDYLDDLKSEEGFEGISDEQALEYLQTIFDIMSGFVKIGYGLEPVQKLIKEFETSATAGPNLLNSKDANHES